MSTPMPKPSSNTSHTTTKVPKVASTWDRICTTTKTLYDHDKHPEILFLITVLSLFVYRSYFFTPHPYLADKCLADRIVFYVLAVTFTTLGMVFCVPVFLIISGHCTVSIVRIIREWIKAVWEWIRPAREWIDRFAKRVAVEAEEIRRTDGLLKEKAHCNCCKFS
ncbi:hypothetical protein BT63DRAFT_451310 [Microthyrium microscopicum]|uniref:Transmembrane protein n=1 Tax=Microthyrium microscopicum TaxID=703497 RepID=A0A6A6UPA0_9PEZI|nr:hypothetical protein BT63DRAFT_451310 [Microthyrium microscopicum]